MRSGTKPLRAAAAVLVWLSLVAVSAVEAGAAGPKRCNGDAQLCERRLGDVVLAATHNSMSAQALGWQIPNQQVGIPEQLRQGVRGFLIDTYYAHRTADGTVLADSAPTSESEIYLCHVACQLGATRLIDALRAMRGFLRAHPNNVLVIVNEDRVAPRDFARVVRRSGLARHLYRGRPGPRWPRLRKMIRRREQVVVLAERQAAPVPWYHEAYSGVLQETPYSWAAPAQLTDPAQWAASCRPNRGGTSGSLFLMNHWSPPVAPDPATSAVVNATETIVGRALACRDQRGRLPNLVAVDMFQSGGLFEAVKRLNEEPPAL
ncbi:MAG TPA: hypothetical protein VEQ61_00955 [Thermoleophilaceae bacterium]|nr:hypothetical protein [Thermoleophilaceae bacterium]